MSSTPIASRLNDNNRRLIERLYGPSSFFDFKRWEQKRALLPLLASSGELGVIPYILPFLLSSQTRSTATKALASLLERRSARDLWNLSQLREAGYYTYAEQRRWADMNPRQVDNLNESAPESVWSLGFASFHRSGYVREAAVRALTRRREHAAVLFLIRRANDWVTPVRVRAKTALLVRLREDPSAFAAALSLMSRLERCGREAHDDLLRTVRETLSREPGLRALRGVMSSDDHEVRRAAYQLALTSPECAPRDIVEQALGDQDIVVRVVAARHALASKNSEWESTLRASRLTAIRRLALERAAALSDAPELHAFLLDKSAGIRADARFFLRRVGVEDFVSTYRTALSAARDDVVAAAIVGLGEVGTPVESERILAFLSSEKPRLRCAAMMALGRLSPGDTAAFMRGLQDANPSVSRAACAVLLKKSGSVSSADLKILFHEAGAEHVKKNAVKLMAKLSRWTALACLLECVAQADENLTTIVLKAIDRWLAKVNSFFVSPKEEEIRLITDALIEAQVKIGRRSEEISLLLEAWAR